MLAWLIPDKLLFRPQAPTYADDESVIKIPVVDGERIAARFYENPNARFTILFSHGNAEDIGRNDTFARQLRDSGFSVLAYDYRGYGRSDGEPSEENTYQDLDAAFGYLTTVRMIPPESIILHGRSLGGGPSVDIASRSSVAGLILESTFTSAARVLTRYTVLPFDKYENISKLPRVSSPVLVIHGKLDATIPFHHGEALFAAAGPRRFALWIEDAGHNNLFVVSREPYLTAIRNFAAELEGGPAS